MGDERSWWRKAWDANKGWLAITTGLTTACLTVLVVIQAIAIRRVYLTVDWGSVSDAFAAFGTLTAVGVALWQSAVIRRQAKEDGVEAAKRFQAEIDAANSRTVQEVSAAEKRFQQEQDAAAKRHEAELKVQREVARVQRVHQREQDFKVATTRIGRAAGSFTHDLATLVAETQRIVALPTRQERDDEIKVIARRLNLASHNLAIEISGAHMLTNNDQLHASLDPILHAGLEATMRASEYENTVIMAGETPNQAPIFIAMQQMNDAVGNVSRLAGELLVTGWDD